MTSTVIDHRYKSEFSMASLRHQRLGTASRLQGDWHNTSCYRDAIRDSRIALSLRDKLIRSLQLIQAFGLPTALVRNWSSLFLNRMLNMVSEAQVFA